MATLTIRNLPDEVYDRLRVRAAENKRSMEAEARALLVEAENTARAKRDSKRADEAVRMLQDMWKSVKPKTGFETLTDEFLAERRAMWGESD